MNVIGRKFIVSIFGESHGVKIGVVIDGVPAGIELSENDFLADLQRRKSGKIGTTPRIEDDLPQIVSGVYNGYTTGAPLTILFSNNNIRSKDYSSIIDTPRPGHADFAVKTKFKGYNDPRGGGHTSGRLTLSLVAAGVVAKKIISPVLVESEILSIGGENPWENILNMAVENGDSLGGIVECRINGLKVGIGDPFFDSVESKISHLAFSIPAIKGIEFGSGFSAALMKGSEHNDSIIDSEGHTTTNNSGGISGGITNGNPVVFRVAVKPTSSISLTQKTINLSTGNVDDLKIEGRHDSCIALRVPVVLESIAAIAIADLLS